MQSDEDKCPLLSLGSYMFPWECIYKTIMHGWVSLEVVDKNAI